MRRLAQSTSYVVMLQVFLASDHVTPATGKTVAITLSKAGAGFGNPNAGASNATEVANGWYKFSLDTTDTNTLGDLVIVGTATACDVASQICQVVSATTGGATNLDAAVSTRASQTSVDDLPTNAELATALAGADDATLAAIAALNNLSAAQVNAEVDTALADYDGPTHAELTAAIAGGDDATLAAISALNNLSATDVRTELSTELGRIDVAVSTRMATYTQPTGFLAATFPSDPADQSLIIAATDQVRSDIAALTIPTANANADALLDRVDAIETGLTLRGAARLITAEAAGKLAVSGNTVTIRNVGDTKARITATTDSNGQRTAVTTDAT